MENKEIKLELKKDSWLNLINCIRNSEIKSKGNFWSAIQYLENQIDDIEE